MPATQVLEYPDLLTRWGIAVEEDARGMRIVIPPVPAWRLLPRSYKFGLSILASMVAFHAATIFRSIGTGARWTDFVPPFVLDALGICIVLTMAYLRLYRRVTFEVTANRLRFASQNLLAGTGDWPREDVIEIRLNEVNGKLIVRARGRDMSEFFISPERQVTRYVIEQLNAAMKKAYEPVPVAAPFAPINENKAIAIRRSLSVLAYGLLAIFVVIWILYPQSGQILLALLIVAAVPLGIWLGTQKKDFFT
jgi:hypothetical protein